MQLLQSHRRLATENILWFLHLQ